MTARTMSARSAWHIGVGAIGASWLLCAVVVALRGMLTSVDPWLPVHLLLLGAVSNAILVWSTYFTEALLRQPRAASRLVEAVRLALDYHAANHQALFAAAAPAPKAMP